MSAHPDASSLSPRLLKTLDIGLRLALGLLFLYASLDKIAHPQDFAVVIRDYRILPPALSNLPAILFPWLELFVGIALIIGVWKDGALLLANLLLLVFWSILIFNYARGLDISCGCFSSKSEAHGGSMLWYVLRDGLFVALGLAAACAAWLRSTRSGALPENLSPRA
jgi:uncharacterized membrane protein YphA (DoxX/SURF4 family)